TDAGCASCRKACVPPASEMWSGTAATARARSFLRECTFIVSRPSPGVSKDGQCFADEAPVAIRLGSVPLSRTRPVLDHLVSPGVVHVDVLRAVLRVRNLRDRTPALSER